MSPPSTAYAAFPHHTGEAVAVRSTSP
jgi:hypothetical protein